MYQNGSALMGWPFITLSIDLGEISYVQFVLSGTFQFLNMTDHDMQLAGKRKKNRHWKRIENMATILETLKHMNRKRRTSLHLADLVEDPKDITGCESLLEAYFLQVGLLGQWVDIQTILHHRNNTTFLAETLIRWHCKRGLKYFSQVRSSTQIQPKYDAKLQWEHTASALDVIFSTQLIRVSLWGWGGSSHVIANCLLFYFQV